jgi:hypothetical protein
MNDSALSLGPIVFQDFEIPSAITLGGRQRMSVRYLSTGQRVTDLLGPDDATISFAGILSGPNASKRARDLDALRTQGRPLDLTWNTFAYSVAIQKFKAEFRTQWWIPYKIHCSVLTNLDVAGIDPILSLANDAVASLALLYNTVPAALLPIPDGRALLASYVASGSTGQANGPQAFLRGSIVTLTAEQQRREATVIRTPLGSALPAPQFLSSFADTIEAARDVQFLALARDCLGQAAVFLG